MLAFCPSILDCDVSTLYIPSLAETLAERCYTALERRGRFGSKIPDHRHRPLLRACHKRPRNRRTAEQRNELAPSHHHSITSSARLRSVGGTSMPSFLAVARLITSSNLADA